MSGLVVEPVISTLSVDMFQSTKDPDHYLVALFDDGQQVVGVELCDEGAAAELFRKASDALADIRSGSGYAAMRLLQDAKGAGQ